MACCGTGKASILSAKIFELDKSRVWIIPGATCTAPQESKGHGDRVPGISARPTAVAYRKKHHGVVEVDEREPAVDAMSSSV